MTDLTRQFCFGEDSVNVRDVFSFMDVKLPITERFVSRLPAEITEAGVVTGGLTQKVNAVVCISEIERFWRIDYTSKEG